MVFAYYHRLSPARRRVYDRSDRINAIRLPDAKALRPLVAELAVALAGEGRSRVEALCQRLADTLFVQLGVPVLDVGVLAVRPHHHGGELHGLYTPAAPPERPQAAILLWMRTAKQRRVVAFRTFLRTLLHEFCHHLDYTLLGLPESFHTEGFYKRESSLFHQLLPLETRPVPKHQALPRSA